jgi:hypothetical protein
MTVAYFNQDLNHALHNSSQGVKGRLQICRRAPLVAETFTAEMGGIGWNIHMLNTQY